MLTAIRQSITKIPIYILQTCYFNFDNHTCKKTKETCVNSSDQWDHVKYIINFFFLWTEGKSLIWYVWQFFKLVCWHEFCIYKVWRLPRFVCSIYWVCWNAWGGHQKKITAIREGHLKKLVDWRGIMNFFKWCFPNPTNPASLIKNECSLKLGKVQFNICLVFLGNWYSTLTESALSTQVYKWVPANLMLGVTLWWTSITSRGE